MGTAARNFYFELDNSGGTLVDLSSYLNQVDVNDDVGMEDTTTFGASVTAKSNTITLTEGGFTINAPYHATLDAQLVSLKGLAATSSFVIGPKGSTAGYPKTSGECRMKSYKRSGQVDGVLKCVAEFVYDGTITEGTF